jgi:hypothetical protein
MNIYHYVDPETSIMTNHHQYSPGMYYREYYLEDGFLKIKKIFSSRSRSIEEQELYVIDLLQAVNDKQILIMHNHVDPINPAVRSMLMNMGKNIYIHRRDKRQQLASYAIAYSTKQFSNFTNRQTSTSLVEDIDPNVLDNLMKRIQLWDILEKGNNQVIAYEDIDFIEIPNFPFKQNKDHSSRLSDKMQAVIDNLVTDYEREKLK